MKAGFTLSELLIALAILGLIATFTIPKVLQSVEQNNRDAVFKETLAALSDITYSGYLDGSLPAASGSYFSYFQDRLDAQLICDDIAADGCWSHDYLSGWGPNSGGFLMKNGAALGDFQPGTGTGCAGNGDGIAIDWNGSDGPNVEGQDQMRVIMNWNNAVCSSVVKPGAVGPHIFFTDSRDLYYEIYGF